MRTTDIVDNNMFGQGKFKISGGKQLSRLVLPWGTPSSKLNEV